MMLYKAIEKLVFLMNNKNIINRLELIAMFQQKKFQSGKEDSRKILYQLQVAKIEVNPITNMKKTDQFQRYKEEQPEFFDKISALEEKHSISIIKRMLSRRYDFDSFCGIMAEVDFGLFLDSFCDKLEFEPVIDGLTPDWRVEVDGSSVLVEVARLKDSHEVQEQTKQDQQAGRIAFHQLKMRPERVFGNAIMTKIEAYGDLVERRRLPFVIGIYNRHLSGAHSEDAGILFNSTQVEDRINCNKGITVESKNTFLEKFNRARKLVSGVLWLDQPPLNPFTWKPGEKIFEYWKNPYASYMLPEIYALEAISGKIL